MKWRVMKQHSQDNSPRELGVFDDKQDARLLIRKELHALMANSMDLDTMLESSSDVFHEPYEWRYIIGGAGTITYRIMVSYQ